MSKPNSKPAESPQKKMKMGEILVERHGWQAYTVDRYKAVVIWGVGHPESAG